MARIFSHLDVVEEFLDQFDEHSSAGSRKSRHLVDDCKSRPEDSVPANKWFGNQEISSLFIYYW